jgi:hypothetical protein
MGLIRVDDAAWPLVVIEFEDVVDDAAFDAYLARLDAVLDRATNVALLFDTTNASRGNPNHQVRHAAWLKRNRERLAQRACCVAIVVPKAIVRAALSGMLLLESMPAAPNAVFRTRPEALAWVHEHMGRVASAR